MREAYFILVAMAGAQLYVSIHGIIHLVYPNCYIWKSSYFARINYLMQANECERVIHSFGYARREQG